MIQSNVLVDNLVALLREIPELLALVHNDIDRIYAYHDQYPKNVSLVHAVHAMPAPSLMVVWQGVSPGSMSSMDVWRHQVVIYIRSRDADLSESPGYCQMFRAIVRGVPASSGLPLVNTTVHPSCYPMDLPSIQRQTDAEGLDYFEMPLTFTEIGDDG